MIVYVDESGDLGWSFDQPYGRGGSSRHLTIAALIVPDAKDHHPERIVRQLYRAGKWDTSHEKKWVDMPAPARETFARTAVNLLARHPDIGYRAIVVRKERVNSLLRRDPNKLYNWMVKLLLLDELGRHERVTLVPDPRTVKVASGRMLDNYLEMLLYEQNAPTQLEVTPLDSRYCLNLQFADMLAGVVQTHYELNGSTCWEVLRPHFQLQTLFFS